MNRIFFQKRIYLYSFLVILFVGFIFILILDIDEGYEQSAQTFSEEEYCNVFGIGLYGDLYTYIPIQSGEYTQVGYSSEDVLDLIDLADSSADIKALLIAIDSFGGDVVAGEEIAHALKNAQKPTVAVIRGVGASAAYVAATGADKIYASQISDVGGIGITLSYLDSTNKNLMDGYRYTELSSAKFKDLGADGRPLTEEEKHILLSDLKKIHDVYVKEVAENRSLEVDHVSKISNGLTYLGMDALGFGLIDEIGDVRSATKYLENQIEEKIEICWY